ncbi:hypothetical protein IGI39_000431 [Enterococcus sp. AZ135]|uniref:alpha/beta hydrolase n=1 Tax=unclassified Enterococcus TaxID=2608891 RepID=UPI003F21BB89
MKKTMTLTNQANYDLYETTQNDKFVLYLHGGGLVYGSKNDLPRDLRDRFLQRGYSVLALDYRLAPNSSLVEILDDLETSVAFLCNTIIKGASFGICGRSAGAFLMLQLTQRLKEKNQAPDFLVNFYGYTDLTFINEERTLLPQKISSKQIEGTELKKPIWDDPLMSRYLLYHYAVQQNLLPSFYGVDSPDEFALSKEILHSFPKTFSSASSSDEEIPFRYSKMIGRSIPDSLFVPVYYLPHDFLKESNKSEVQVVLDKLADWLP